MLKWRKTTTFRYAWFGAESRTLDGHNVLSYFMSNMPLCLIQVVHSSLKIRRSLPHASMIVCALGWCNSLNRVFSTYITERMALLHAWSAFYRENIFIETRMNQQHIM